MILPLDIIGIIFEKINSYGLILSLTSKYFNKFYGEINNKTKLEEFLSFMTIPLIKYMWNFQIIHIYKLTVLCEKIAIYGNLEVLKWARENGCEWNSYTCSYAAEGGHLEVLKWARDNGCEWSSYTCAYAAYGGHLEVLKWARDNGCVWNSFTCSRAARGGHLEVLKWARDNG